MPWRKLICIAKCLYSYRDDLPKNLLKKSGLKSGKSPLPFDVRRSKTSLLKLPNMEGRKRSKRSLNSEPWWRLSISDRQEAKVSRPLKCPRARLRISSLQVFLDVFPVQFRTYRTFPCHSELEQECSLLWRITSTCRWPLVPRLLLFPCRFQPAVQELNREELER